MSVHVDTAPFGRPDVYLLSFGDLLPDPTTGRVASEGERIRSVVAQAVIAERHGFTGVALGEHHFMPYVISCPMLLLAAIAMQTSRIRLSTAVTLLANRDPVHVAEELATLDALSDGRAEIVVARGISRETNTAFGIPPDELRPRFEEHLRLLLRLLEETDVTWSGQYRAALDGVTTRPRPVPRPRPGVWIGTGSEASAELAAETRLPLMLPSTLRPPAGYRDLVERYRQRLGTHGRVGLPSHVFVAPTTAEAWARWRPHLNAIRRACCAVAGRRRQDRSGPADAASSDLRRSRQRCGRSERACRRARA